MSEHYFSKVPQTKSDPKTWQAKLRNYHFTFTSDFGMFSRDRIDFGSQLLIETFQAPPIEGRILDLGCGYGPVGISLAASFPERQIIMSDINERALSFAQKNIQQNNINNATTLISDRFERLTGPFAAILTNPPIRAGKRVIYKMFAESYEALKESGELWIVIQRKQGAPSAARKLQEIFGNAQLVDRKKGYHIYKMVKT